MIIKAHFNNRPFNEWDDDYKYRDVSALTKFYYEHFDDVDAVKFVQFLYAYQFNKLHKFANDHGIKIIGDMPIYVAYDSCDVWKDPRLFMLDEYLKPTEVAGVPPDYFSATGQLWGNPLYNYQIMKEDNYDWWVKRIEYALRQADLVRIDHFRGFSAFYAIPYGAENAINGRWIKGPGKELFDIINTKLNNPAIIAENLGLLDDDVNKLIKHTGYPGMKIFEFEVYSQENIDKLKKDNKNNIFYPGTHDNNTFIGYLDNEASDTEKAIINHEFGNDDLPINIKLIRYAYKFPFDTVIIMYQDILGLGSEARINMPGRPYDNWKYKFKEEDFPPYIAELLKKYQ